MNYSELQARVFAELGEDSADPSFHTASDVQAALADGYEELSDSTEWYERDAVLHLLSHQQYYDLRSIVDPNVFLRLRAVFNTTTKKWLDPVGLVDLDYRTYTQWEDVTGEPEKWLVRGCWWLRFFPMRPSDSGVCQLFYPAVAPALSNGTDEPGFPTEFHLGLVEYAVGDLLSQEGETKKALGHFAEYRKYQEGLQQWVDGRTALDRVNRLRG